MRYLIVEKERGLFLGIYHSLLIFAKNNIFPIVKVPSFNSEDEAMQFIASTLSKEGLDCGVIIVNSKEKYVNIVDVIKAGYSEYTHDLIDNIPMISEKIH